MSYPLTKRQSEALAGLDEFLLAHVRDLLGRAHALRDSLVRLPCRENGVAICHGSNLTVSRAAECLFEAARVLAHRLPAEVVTEFAKDLEV